MPSMRVVPAFDEAEDFSTCGGMAVEFDLIDELAFEGREEALAHCVVVTVSDRSHRGSDAFVEAALSEGDRGVLASLVGVVDHGFWSALLESHVEGSKDEFGPEVILDAPSDDLSAPAISVSVSKQRRQPATSHVATTREAAGLRARSQPET